MPNERNRKRRRLWAGATLIVAFASIAASVVVWTMHLIEYIYFRSIHHTTLAKLFGINNPLLETGLCLALPAIGLLSLYLFFAIWAVGVERGRKRTLAVAGSIKAAPPGWYPQ
jgi:hypothetical protein